LIQLLSLFLVLSMPGTAILVGVVRRVAAWEIQGNFERIRPWVLKVHRYGALGVILLAVAIWLLRGPLIHALSLPGSDGLVEVLTAGGLWVVVCIDRGLLQAKRAYRDVSANLIVEGSVRMVAMVGFSALGLGLSGAALGLLLAELAAVVHARVRVLAVLHHLVPSEQGSIKEDVDSELLVTSVAAPLAGEVAGGDLHSGRDLFADIAAAFVGLALLAVLQNADLIILGSKAAENRAAYASISVASKALVFWALTFSNYLLAEATIGFHRRKGALRQLSHTLGILVVPAVVLLIAAFSAPALLLRIVFRSHSAAAASAFPELVIAMIFLCVSIVITNYLLASARRWVVGILAGGAALLVILVLRSEGGILGTARGDLTAQGAIAAALTAALFVHHRLMRSSS
jgi:hypothetical protein